MFNFIKTKLQKIFTTVTSQLGSFFNKKVIDEAALKELELILIGSDVGVATTQLVIAELKKEIASNATGAQLKEKLHSILLSILLKHSVSLEHDKQVFLFVGINGSGKTTTIAKLAHYYAQQHKKILLVAADTFRAAATEQLAEWAKATQTDMIAGKEGQDPASVVFQGCQAFKNGEYDILIIDTAGRLQTKVNLMHELSKIKRSVVKQLNDMPIITLLTIDSMLGQNSFEQAKIFKDATDVNGIVLTKMDGTGKGGIVFSIAHELAIPVAFLTFGEQADQIKKFDPQQYVTELLG